MEHSESIKNIAVALRKFQGAVDAVLKSADNPFFKSKYAPLEAIIDHVQEHMVREGLSFSQFPDGDGLTTILMHDSGEWIKAKMNLNLVPEYTKADVNKERPYYTPQAHGSAITYARRYALSAVLGLATEEDDDGNAASQPKERAEKPRVIDKEVTAQKKRIMFLLKQLDAPHATKAQVEASVLGRTKLELKEENYDRIGNALAAQLEASDALK